MTMVFLTALLHAQIEGLTTGRVELVADGFQFTEGPVWLPENRLIFSDIPADTIYYGDKTVFRKPSGKSNGLTLDHEGRLIACEHWNRRVTRTEKDGTVNVLADAYNGKKLNSPNDAVVRTDGRVFFTDPPYGLEGRDKELDVHGVYTINPDGSLILLVDDFDRPNGIALSPDQKTLYVSDSRAGHIRAFDVAEDGTVSNGRVFCDVQGPDGMAIDTDGRVWSTSADAIRVFNPDGSAAGVIETEKTPANCAFGGNDFKTLYITARDAVYKVSCTVAGWRPGHP